ncbi:uncharacterized protein LOC144095640 isoform X1 [Amblyomma americanum]
MLRSTPDDEIAFFFIPISTPTPTHIPAMASLEFKAESSAEPTAMSRSARAGLWLPVGRIHRLMCNGKYAERIGSTAAVYMAAVLEYLTAELLQLASNGARDNGARDNAKTLIMPCHIQLAIRSHDLRRLRRKLRRKMRLKASQRDGAMAPSGDAITPGGGGDTMTPGGGGDAMTPGGGGDAMTPGGGGDATTSGGGGDATASGGGVLPYIPTEHPPKESGASSS